MLACCLRAAVSVICCCAALGASAAFSEDPHLPDMPKNYAAIVRPKLPSGWHCTYDFQTLVISHDDEVTFLNTLGLPSTKRDEKMFKEFGFQGPYLIVIKFVSRLSEAEQRALADHRRQAVKEAVKGREREKYTGKDVYERHFCLSISTRGSVSICRRPTPGR
jgi:hypothetical protein